MTSEVRFVLRPDRKDEGMEPVKAFPSSLVKWDRDAGHYESKCVQVHPGKSMLGNPNRGQHGRHMATNDTCP